jgi:hypothetical protein
MEQIEQMMRRQGFPLVGDFWTSLVDENGCEHFAQVRVTYYEPGWKGSMGYHAANGDLIDPVSPPDPETVEWELLDKNGEPAPAWLESLTDCFDIEAQCVAHRNAALDPEY